MRVVRKTDIRTQKILEFPTTQNTEPVETEQQLTSNEEVVRNKDYPETDTPTIWRSNADATRYCQIPPIHDQATGVEIQRQMDEEGLTAQKVVSRAIAFSKVPLMLLETLGAIGSKLVEGLSLVELAPPEPSESTPVNVESAIALLARTMGRTTSTPAAPKLYGKGNDKIEYFRDKDLKECGVNLNDENLINVAIAASSKDFEIATDCFLNWIAKQHTDDEGNVLKTDRLGIVHKTTATQKFINAINYKWKPHGYEEKIESEKLQNASAYSNTPVSVYESYFKLIKEALSSDEDGDFIRAATMKIVPLCNENEEFFGFDFAKRCFEIASKNPKSILINSVKSLVKRFGDKWGVAINDDGQVVAV